MGSLPRIRGWEQGLFPEELSHASLLPPGPRLCGPPTPMPLCPPRLLLGLVGRVPAWLSRRHHPDMVVPAKPDTSAISHVNTSMLQKEPEL